MLSSSGASVFKTTRDSSEPVAHENEQFFVPPDSSWDKNFDKTTTGLNLPVMSSKFPARAKLFDKRIPLYSTSIGELLPKTVPMSVVEPLSLGTETDTACAKPEGASACIELETCN